MKDQHEAHGTAVPAQRVPEPDRTSPSSGDAVAPIPEQRREPVLLDPDAAQLRARHRRTSARLRSRLLVLADIVLAAVVLVVGDAFDTRTALVLALGWPLLVGVAGGYAVQLHPSGQDVLRTLSVAALLGVAIAQLGLEAPEPRRTAIFSVLVVYLLSTLLRLGPRLYRLVRGQRGIPVVAIGDPFSLNLLAEDLEDIPGHDFDLRGAIVLGESTLGMEAVDVPLRRGLEQVVPLVAERGATAVLALPSPGLSRVMIRQLSWRLEAAGVELLVSPGVSDVVPGRTAVTGNGGLPVLHVRPAALHGTSRRVKSCWERTAALLALLALSPLLLLTTVLIRLDSPGPALFRQTRVGRDDRPFTMLKFRTMVQDADARLAELAAANEADGPLFKVRHDPRITRLGRFLRQYSIDELPQLWNVVKGDMALVGPRPPLPHEVAAYDAHTHRRMAVKPGLTGLWQVSGRSDLSWKRSVRLDLHYVDNWSLGLDLRIICRTVRAVLARDGAY